MPLQRKLKNLMKNYSEVECKVREATSNDPWGPTSQLMAELSDITYNILCFNELMLMLWRRLNEKQTKNWRHIYKSLILLEYLIKTGSDDVSIYCREHLHHIESLLDFNYNEEGRDLGQIIRTKAKDVIHLLQDSTWLSSERVKALKAKERLSEAVESSSKSLTSTAAISSSTTTSTAQSPFKQTPLNFRRFIGTPRGGGSSSSANAFRSMRLTSNRESIESQIKSSDDNNLPPPPPYNPQLYPVLDTEISRFAADRPTSSEQEDIQLQIALAMSREEAEMEAKRRQKDEEEMMSKVLRDSGSAGGAVHHQLPPTSASPKSLSPNEISSGFIPPTSFSSSSSSSIPPPAPPAAVSGGTQSQFVNGSLSSSPTVATHPTSSTISGLFEMIDISLSAAPANQPDPWGESTFQQITTTLTTDGGQGGGVGVIRNGKEAAGETLIKDENDELNDFFPPSSLFLSTLDEKETTRTTSLNNKSFSNNPFAIPVPVPFAPPSAAASVSVHHHSNPFMTPLPLLGGGEMPPILSAASSSSIATVALTSSSTSSLKPIHPNNPWYNNSTTMAPSTTTTITASANPMTINSSSSGVILPLQSHSIQQPTFSSSSSTNINTLPSNSLNPFL